MKEFISLINLINFNCFIQENILGVSLKSFVSNNLKYKAIDFDQHLYECKMLF